MIRGMSFEIKKRGNRILKEIFENINVLKYCWYSIEEQREAWCFVDSREKEFLENEYYQGQDFLEAIRKDHYIVFLKLEAYLEETNCYDIHSYEEFQNSKCKILLLIYDCNFVEIFAQDEKVIRKFYENARKKKFGEIEFITDTNDKRTILDVL